MEKITLAMMVLNEEENIIRTLSSCHTFISELFLLDTGSVDGTIKVAREFCDKHEIKLHLTECIMSYFDVTRNKLLDIVEKSLPPQTLFMVLDANEEIRYKFLPAFSAISKDIVVLFVRSYWLDSKDITTTQDKVMFLRTGSGVRYRGYVHEDVIINGEIISNRHKTEDMTLYQNRKKDDLRSAARADRDIEWLTQELLDYPDHPVRTARARFCLARTYSGKSDHQKALHHFNILYNVKGLIDLEIAYLTRFYIAMCLEATNSDWEKILFYLLEAYQANPDKIEPIMGLANYYYNRGKLHLADQFSRWACEQIYKQSINNTESVYTFSRWYTRAAICYDMNKFDEGKKAFDKIEERYIPALFLDKYKNLFNCYYPFCQEIRNREVILLFGGFSRHVWDAASLSRKDGLGGSETSVLQFAKHLVQLQKLPVVICTDCIDPTSYNGVYTIPIKNYDSFIESNQIDTLIVFRFRDYIRYHSNINKIMIILEDVVFVDAYTTEKLQDSHKMTQIICKTKWHRKAFIEKYTHNTNIPHDKIVCIGNGIDITRFTEHVEDIPKIPWRFIYTSCPHRGAYNLVRLIPRILEIVPEATFHFFIDFEDSCYKNDPKMIQLKNILLNMNGVTLHSRVSQDQLAVEIIKSDIWLFHTNFTETYCISALEMQLGRVLCIYSDLAALSETVGDRGISIPFDSDGDQNFILAIKKLKNGQIRREDYLDRAYQWAIQQTWESRACQLLELNSC